MITKEIIQAIIDRLKENIPSNELRIDMTPDDPKEFQIEHPRGAIIVSYAGSSGSEPSGVQQALLHNLSITLCLRNELNEMERLDYLDRVRQSITGDMIINGFSVYWSSTLAPEEYENVWYYNMGFILPGIGYIGE